MRDRIVLPVQRRAASKSWHRPARARKWCERTWTERVEDGRVRYAMASLGLGLLVGSLLSIVGDNTALLNWKNFGYAPISFLSTVCGICLFGLGTYPRFLCDQEWTWKRRPLIERRLIAKA